MLELIGIILPALIDFINSKVSESKARFWVSVAICSVFGIGVNFIEHNGSGGYTGLTLLMIADSLSKSALAMFAVAQISYKAIWENSDVRNSTGMNARTNGTDNSGHV